MASQHNNKSTPADYNMNRAFVIGNGTSRASINLEALRDYGKIYGCNAIYRDFIPDVLIGVDTKMVLEINQNQIQHKTEFWTNPNKAYLSMNNINTFNPSKGWSSGPTALWKASEDGADEVYILGFDYVGLGNSHEYVNNVYAGTLNYKKQNEKATYFGNWLKQTVITMQKFKEKRYIRVLADPPFVPKELANINNLEQISLVEFKKIFINS